MAAKKTKAKKNKRYKCKADWLSRRLMLGPYLCLCLSQQEYEDALDDLQIPERDRDSFVNPNADATLHTHYTEDDQAVSCIVCLKERRGRLAVEIYGLLIHEAVHVWQQYSDYIGEYTPGSEQEAYCIQAISQELIHQYQKRRYGRRNR